MKLKTVEVDGKTYAEVQDGKPVFIDDAGKEIAFDAPATKATITRLNGEAQGHRERAEKAEKDLKAFEGITDPAAAKKALETVSSLDQKKLIDAGEVDKVKEQAIAAVEEKYKPVVAERDKLLTDLHGEKIGNGFANSKFISEKSAIPADLMQARFGQHFKVEDGKTVAYDATGNKLYSSAKPGELADFDEALEMLVGAYPHRDSILKGAVGAGGGAGQGGGGGNGSKSLTRTAFEALPAGERATKMREGYSLTD